MSPDPMSLWPRFDVELHLTIAAPEHLAGLCMPARFAYSSSDPWVIRLQLLSSEWIVSRADARRALDGRAAGVGDVRIEPLANGDISLKGCCVELVAKRPHWSNLVGRAECLVPPGSESGWVDPDAELARLVKGAPPC